MFTQLVYCTLPRSVRALIGWPPRVAWPVAGAYAAVHALWLAYVARAPKRDPSVDYLPLAAPPINDARRRASTSVDF